jgi:polyferredoxin
MKVATRQRFRKGLMLVSFLLFPITMYYLSPYLIIEGAGQGIVTGSFIAFGLMFVSALTLGRGFCAWACPGGGLQELCTLAQEKPARTGKLDWIKWGIWVPWLGGIVAAAVAAGGLTRIEPLFQTVGGISIAEPVAYITYYFFLALIVILALAAGRRSFCHYVCWMAPFMVLGRKVGNVLHVPSLRLRADSDACTDCGTCTKACPMSLPVGELVARGDMEDAECILCGTCVDGCRSRAIAFGYGGR